MRDVVIISKPVRLGFGDQILADDRTSPGVYNVFYARLNSDKAKEFLLSGRPLNQMPKGTVVDHGEILAPEGLPADPNAPGSPCPGSLEDAKSLAEIALANPNSEVRIKGLSSMTPIFEWLPNGPSKRLA